MPLENHAWLPDYISGLEKLQRQLALSLGQLHELRKLVFSYMKHHHANGEFLRSLADSSLAIDSAFPRSRGQRQASGRSVNMAEPESDMSYCFRQVVERTAANLRLEQDLASEIDRAVLDKVTQFLKTNEPAIVAALLRLNGLFADYEESLEDLEKTKHDYTKLARLAEFAQDPDTCRLPAAGAPPVVQPTTPTKPNRVEHRTPHFEFPLHLGGAVFELPAQLQDTITFLMATVATTKRKIPVPGHRSEIFSSEELCAAFGKRKINRFVPTRSSSEKLGQALLDHKLICGTGFFAKRFTSEGSWLEWSDTALQLAGALPAQPPDDLRKPKNLEETWSNMAESTSKTLNGVFQSVRSSLNKPRYSQEVMAETEARYNDAYEEMLRAKHMLEMELLRFAQLSEHFEKQKIALIYDSLDTLQETLRKHAATKHEALDTFAEMFRTKLNTQENKALEYLTSTSKFHSGVYFPSMILNKQSMLKTAFQNVRLEINLYKDVPLQLKKELDLLSMSSVPLFLHGVISLMEKIPSDQLRVLWTEPLSYDKYWLAKSDMRIIAQSLPTNATEKDAIEAFLSKLQTTPDSRLVNFCKNWLLEISDSVIPSTVYDSLLSLYFKSADDGPVNPTKILGLIPRSNLSALLRILEHMCQVYKLDILENYGMSDEDAEQEPRVKQTTVENVARTLNEASAVASVPFTHLILRPSVVKHATGFTPNVPIYNRILTDLLLLTTRQQLFTTLVANEQKFKVRQQQQDKNLGIQKRDRATSRASDTLRESLLQAPRSPKPLKGDFELRPFRTGTSPRPLSQGLPVHRSTSERNSVDPVVYDD